MNEILGNLDAEKIVALVEFVALAIAVIGGLAKWRHAKTAEGVAGALVDAIESYRVSKGKHSDESAALVEAVGGFVKDDDVKNALNSVLVSRGYRDEDKGDE